MGSEMCIRDRSNVTRGIGYVSYIKSFTSPILSETQVRSITAQIESGRLEPSRRTDKEHVKNLKARHKSESDKVCRTCGKGMILRTAKKGANSGKQFWGCSGYPKCRSVQKIN